MITLPLARKICIQCSLRRICHRPCRQTRLTHENRSTPTISKPPPTLDRREKPLGGPPPTDRSSSRHGGAHPIGEFRRFFDWIDRADSQKKGKTTGPKHHVH